MWGGFTPQMLPKPNTQRAQPDNAGKFLIQL